MSTTPENFSGHKCTCPEYHAEEQKKQKKRDDLSVVPFWLTFSGLMMRVDVLAQDFLFGVTNDTFINTAEESPEVYPQIELNPLNRPQLPPPNQPSTTPPQSTNPQEITPQNPTTQPTPENKPIILPPPIPQKLIPYLHYLTAEDDKVCPICNGYGQGGEKGYYRATDPKKPSIPVHRRCRCQWGLVIADLTTPALP